MSTAGRDPGGTTGHQPTEEELRAAYEAEIKRIRVDHVLLEHVVTLVNLGMRRTGLAPGTETERDPAQVQLAIEAIRSLLPLLERSAPEQIGPIRDALSQLQLAFVRIGGTPASAAGEREAEPAAGGGERASEAGGGAPSGGHGAPANDPEPPKPGEAGPAQRSGRLWIPGQ
jgi:hypothetical protein